MMSGIISKAIGSGTAGRPAATPHASGFRPDIEGLRALAVLPILFNHAHVRGFLGGFIGVDIFFVISGYLITGILARDVAAGQFSIAGFYRRRVLRIFPALFATLAVTTAISWVALTPPELVTYARSLIAAILFVSNVQFWFDTGYFTASASSRPLLHTWSLAVEEQFYVFWPLLIAAIGRRSRQVVLAVVGVVTALSFALAVWMMAIDTSGAFYLIPFRAWELGVGGVLALLQRGQVRPLPRPVREAAGIAGVGVILWCVRYYIEPIAFPGWTAVPPCLATAAIIMAGPDTLVGRGLSLQPARFLGRISYSLYLWHWPVIVFAGLWLFLPMTVPVIAGEVIASLAIATASYYWIEIGLRRPLARLATPRLLALAGAAMAVGVLVGGVILAGRGFPDRYDAHRVTLAQALERDEEAAYRRGSCFALDGRYDARSCLARHAPGPTILLIGDSTAAHLWPGFAREAGRYDIRQATMIGCPPQIAPDNRSMPCLRFFRELLTDWARAHRPAAVMLAGNWQMLEADQLPPTLTALRAQGQRTIIVGPMPRYTSALPRLLFFGEGADLQARAQGSLDPGVWGVDRKLRAETEAAGATYISPLTLLCPAQRCRVLANPDVPMQFDNVHLTTEGSQILVKLMMPQIDAALARSPSGGKRVDGLARSGINSSDLELSGEHQVRLTGRDDTRPARDAAHGRAAR